ncbi:protein-tyrosine phosphatase [Dysgonomonadaceae bacterium PH5-43]|nr:protein-tyrosine phosphatase [Dysgonomonadaceae bacterium PH5-43]
MSRMKVLFVCTGNICRSPAAEGIMKKKIKDAGLEDKFFVDSAGTHGIHEGELPDPRMRERASKRGYMLDTHSRPITPDDFYEFDIIVAMDDYNIKKLHWISPDLESRNKIVLMTDFCENVEADHVPDPYYGGVRGFELVLNILEDAVDGLMKAKN